MGVVDWWEAVWGFIMTKPDNAHAGNYSFVLLCMVNLKVEENIIHISIFQINNNFRLDIIRFS